MGQARTIHEVAQTLARVMGVDLEPEITQQFRAGDIRHCIADISRLHAAYDFVPQCALTTAYREWWAWAQQEQPRTVCRTPIASSSRANW